MGFEVQLIHIPETITAIEATELARNCSPVIPRWWIFEGDLEVLEVRNNLVAEGVTGGGLNDKTEDEMIQHCKDIFDIDVQRHTFDD